MVTTIPKRNSTSSPLRGGFFGSLLILFFLAAISTGQYAQADTGTWFLRSSTATPYFTAITRGGELFVAVGEGIVDNGDETWSHSGSGAMMVSAGGGNWVDIPAAASLPVLRGVTWAKVDG